jgi:aryl-alcohol dehydrogenase-like predicted oxidoreductase
LDAGINFVDTADVYAFGQSEEIVGHALRGRRDGVILASKVNNRMGDDPNQAGNSRRWIRAGLEASLRRLGTDYLDLYQLHRPDAATDIDESLGALSDLVHQGKIRAFGTSTFPAHQLVEAQWVAEQRNRERPVTEQPPYSIFARGIEADILPTCQRYQLGVAVWSPLNGGWLTGKYRRGVRPPAGSRADREPDHIDLPAQAERKLDAVEALVKLAADAGISLTHLALAWTLVHPAVTATIIGPRTLDQLEAQLGADEIRLAPDLLDAIDALVAPGQTLSARDRGWEAPELADPAARRRP